MRTRQRACSGIHALPVIIPAVRLNICEYLSSRRVEVRRCWVIAMDPRAETLAQGAACDFFKRYALHSLKSPPTGGALVVVQFS